MADDPIDVAEMLAAYRQVARPSGAVKRRIVRELDEVPAPRGHAWTIAAFALAAAVVLVLAWRASAVVVRTEPTRAGEQAPYQGAPPRAEPSRGSGARPQPAVPPAIAPRVPTVVPEAAPPPSRPRAAVAETPVVGSAAPEIALLEQARIELAAGRAEAALAIVLRHAREFPRGQLGEEREALRVLASCELHDRRAAALELRREFLRRHPRSTYADRVRAACDEATHESHIP